MQWLGGQPLGEVVGTRQISEGLKEDLCSACYSVTSAQFTKLLYFFTRTVEIMLVPTYEGYWDI